ncbi:Acriflavine sensitivity control protein acr-2 [Cytospora mali]|uniref:Acriflavine sensitivity control protein acr-2 n=1 Tax=Cytospora mali TaxID=578113 RepID=A0A194US31_CYTMA|nr:Acriflavine sensitivity control protein acr-2 [Valsa mali var. pyri (nom. inval.)]
MTVPSTAQLSITLPTKACHNCRRNRLRCDRSLPQCQKCSSKGDQCQGYGRLLRWANAAAVKGKLAEQVGQRPHAPLMERQTWNNSDHHNLRLQSGENSKSDAGVTVYPVKSALVDPLLKDLSPQRRLYISHFSNVVCQDLVSFDQRDHTNPFRSVITLLGTFDYLREIILATSAVHMVTLRRSRNHPHQRELVDALAAKGRAYRLLRQALDHLDVLSRPIVFIAVVFFINFDLIDSGRGSWKTHIEAAGKLIASIQQSVSAPAVASAIPPSVAQLADIVIADCITYHILGSGFAGPEEDDKKPTNMSAAFAGIDVPATLQRAAAFSYGCYPPSMLDILSKASRLVSGRDVVEAGALIDQLRGMDVRAWVYGIEGLSPNDELEFRVSMASAHRVATCLYIVLAVPDVMDHRPDLVNVNSVESLTREVLHHLAFVPVDHALAKGLIWPTFMAGAQTEDLASRQWCLGRMQRIWQSTPWICPWGYIESAINMLQRVWETRDRKLKEGNRGGMNWLQELKATADQVLIV